MYLVIIIFIQVKHYIVSDKPKKKGYTPPPIAPCRIEGCLGKGLFTITGKDGVAKAVCGTHWRVIKGWRG